MNNLDSWRAFLGHVKTDIFFVGQGGALPPPPWTLYQGFEPTGDLGSPLDPWPDLLFSK